MYKLLHVKDGFRCPPKKDHRLWMTTFNCHGLFIGLLIVFPSTSTDVLRQPGSTLGSRQNKYFHLGIKLQWSPIQKSEQLYSIWCLQSKVMNNDILILLPRLILIMCRIISFFIISRSHCQELREYFYRKSLRVENSSSTIGSHRNTSFVGHFCTTRRHRTPKSAVVCWTRTPWQHYTHTVSVRYTV